jgi:CheY-like chemotaxis protein
LINDATQLIQRLAGAKIKLNLDLQPDLGRVWADRDLMQQAVLNLADFACSRMPDGGTITLETAKVSADFGRGVRSAVRLSIKDTGPTPPEGTLEKVFDPFLVIGDAGDRDTGFGMALTYSIVRQEDGLIQAQSSPTGLRIDVLLPKPKETEAADPDSEAAGQPKTTILVVEDEETVLEMAVRILKNQGFNVLEARSGEEALVVCQKSNPPVDLLLADIVMPGMEGTQLAARVQKLWPDTRIILMSGYTSGLEEGASPLNPPPPFLQKPFTPKELTRKIKEALKKK